jgi:hypothetical protein
MQQTSSGMTWRFGDEFVGVINLSASLPRLENDLPESLC